MTDAVRKLCSAITPVKEGLAVEARAHLDNLTKPRGSLGRLEELAVRLFCIAGGKKPLSVDPALVLTTAGDHGVVAQGTTLYPQDVTRQMVRNFLNDGAGINVLCKVAGLEQRVVDAGCAGGPFSPHPRLIDVRLGDGTADIALGPAMSRESCEQALLRGAGLAGYAAAEGFRCIVIGEMGIGNTTTASALLCALYGLPAEDMVGEGAGLNPAGLAHKTAVVNNALQANRAALAGGAADKLAALGGFEIAVMSGIVLGAARHSLPVAVDGFISTAAFAAAANICPAAAQYGFLSHLSAERGHNEVVKALNVGKPLLDLGLRLGEGTGGALAVFLLRAAAAVYNEMATFESALVSGHPA